MPWGKPYGVIFILKWRPSGYEGVHRLAHSFWSCCQKTYAKFAQLNFLLLAFLGRAVRVIIRSTCQFITDRQTVSPICRSTSALTQRTCSSFRWRPRNRCLCNSFWRICGRCMNPWWSGGRFQRNERVVIVVNSPSPTGSAFGPSQLPLLGSLTGPLCFLCRMFRLHRPCKWTEFQEIF